MELVDPTLPPSNPLSNFLIRLQESHSDTFHPPLKGEGWGSTQATEMVLNNLFYITVKVSLTILNKNSLSGYIFTSGLLT